MNVLRRSCVELEKTIPIFSNAHVAMDFPISPMSVEIISFWMGTGRDWRTGETDVFNCSSQEVSVMDVFTSSDACVTMRNRMIRSGIKTRINVARERMAAESLGFFRIFLSFLSIGERMTVTTAATMMTRIKG